jgi:hypothetical protein
MEGRRWVSFALFLFLVLVSGDYVLGKGATRRSPRERRKARKEWVWGQVKTPEAVAVGSGSNVSCAGQGPEPFGAAFSFPGKNTSPPRGRVKEELTFFEWKNYL